MKSASKSSNSGSNPSAARITGPEQPGTPERVSWTGRAPGRLLLLTGWLLPQFLLLGPALVGQTVNLPVDLLVIPNFYLPKTPQYQHVVPYHGMSLVDLVLVYAEAREYATREVRAGRLPLWQPSNFAGTPFAGWPKYSPFELPYYVAPGPVTYAWMLILPTLVCGLGMWLFLRHALCLSYWPAAVASWCAPLTGFITLWQGSQLVVPVCWLPWLLVAVHWAVRKPWGWSGVCLAGVTTLLLICGGLDVAGLVLLSVGFYAVWLVATEHLSRRQWRCAAFAASGVAAGWLVGFLLGAAYLVPLQEYVRTGARVEARAAGSEERPPVGLSELPAVVLPDVNGSDNANSLPLDNMGNRLESSSAACAGLLAVLWLAPLAWFHPGLRRQSIFFTVLAIAGLGWTLNLPGFVHILRIKPLNMLSYNRWVFATADAVLVLAAIGMEALHARRVTFRRRYAIPFMLLAAGFGGWCLICAFDLPEPLHSQIETAIRNGRGGNVTLERLRAAQATFTVCYAIGAALSLAALVGWLAIWKNTRVFVWGRAALVVLIPAQLIWFAWGERRQADRALYFPPVPALEKLAALPPGRIWGVDCLPPNMNQYCGLEDVRGNDSVDPAPFIKLFDLMRDPRSASSYAVTQEAVPALLSIDHRVKLHPVADLLNVRYLVLRTAPPPHFPVVVHEADYWVLENRDALPRAFVPRSVKVVGSDREALAVMKSPQFNPRETVLMSNDPHAADSARGTAAIRYETPTHATLDVNMSTAGMVVVSDLWDPGWRAELDGTACPIDRVDTALRGVRAPAGNHRIALIYDPPSVRRGFHIAGAGAVLLLVWSAAIVSTLLPRLRRG